MRWELKVSNRGVQVEWTRAFAALERNVRVPAGETPRRVVASDLKVRLIVQVCPGAMGEGVQVLVCEKLVVSESVTLVTVRGSWPEEETVRVEVAVPPRSIGPKMGGDRVSVAAATPGVMVKVCGFDTGGPTVVSGAEIVMAAVPVVATSEAGTVARRELLLT